MRNLINYFEIRNEFLRIRWMKFYCAGFTAHRPKSKQNRKPGENSIRFQSERQKCFSRLSQFKAEKYQISRSQREDSFCNESVSISNFFFSIARIHQRSPTSRFNFSYFSISSKHHFVCHRAVIRFLIKNSSPNSPERWHEIFPISINYRHSGFLDSSSSRGFCQRTLQ